MKQFIKWWLIFCCLSVGIHQASAQLGRVQFDVVHDVDSNCQLSASDEFLPHVILSAHSLSTQRTFYISSDSLGLYTTQLMRDSYDIEAHLIYGESLWQLCQASRRLYVQGGRIDTIFIGLQSLINRPLVTSDLTSAWISPCDTGWVNIALNNVGAAGLHQAMYALELDNHLHYLRHTAPSGVAVTVLGSSRLTIDVNTMLATNRPYLIQIQAYADCSGIAATDVYRNKFENITDSLPLAAPIAPKINIATQCIGSDSIQFWLRNRGSLDMSTSSNYIVIEDDVMLRQGTYQLQMGQNETITIPSSQGKTYRIETRQPAPLPAIHADSLAWLVVPDCDSLASAAYVMRYADQFYTGDATPFAEHDVASFGTITAAVAQNASPLGYGAPHLIEQGTPIEYIIYFQNTTSSALPFITIVDTLSDLLDVSTFEPTAASSHYSWTMSDSGRVQIALSASLAVGEKGFFAFKIRPESPLPLGTVIPNTAYVNLGFAAPTATNIVTHTIGNNFIRILSDKLYYQLNNNLRIFPNPVGDRARFELIGNRWGKLQLEVFNELGQLVSSTGVEHQQVIDFERNNLARGIYFYRFLYNGELYDTGKIILY